MNAEVDDLKILFVDDDALDIVYEKYELERNGITFASRVAASELEVIHELAEFVPDVVLCDYTMHGFAGPRALDTLLRLRPATPVLMVSGSIDDDTANQCLKGGATDYVLKENLGRLGPAVRRAVGNARHRQALESRIDELSNYDALTGLPNLTQAKHEIGLSFERARSRSEVAALVVLNLDQYHRVNGSFGRRVSDDMLCDIELACGPSGRLHYGHAPMAKLVDATDLKIERRAWKRPVESRQIRRTPWAPRPEATPSQSSPQRGWQV